MQVPQWLKDISRPYRHAFRRAGLQLVSGALTAAIKWRWAHRKTAPLHTLPGELIVSLTSFPARFDALPLTLRCLLTQSLRPDRVVLWIAEVDRPLLTPQILELTVLGLEIRYCPDWRSYKKIIPALSAFPGAFIVTADDDLYYRRDWLQELVQAYQGDNTRVLCQRAHRIVLDEKGLPSPYRCWNMETELPLPSPLVFPTSGAGALYPPGVLHATAVQVERFLALCPTADDIWLYWMMRLQGGLAQTVGRYRTLYSWHGTQEDALWQVNLTGGANDTQLQAMQQAYPLVFTMD